MLQFFNVKKIYGLRQILDIPFLELDNGIYWLQGVNGSGKTTLLRMIAGILPFKGSIRLGGLCLQQNAIAYRRLVGWADAEPQYPGFLSGEDLVNFYLGIQKPRPGQIEELLERFDVRPWLSSRTAVWSNGMTKKISLLLAFLGQPSLITLDEPLITLDERSITGLYALILEWRRQYGTSFLLSSHQDIQANRLPDVQKLVVSKQSVQLIR
jgi:ABC-2 type transport system ATP-binding protein